MRATSNQPATGTVKPVARTAKPVPTATKRSADLPTRLAALEGLDLPELRKAWWHRYRSPPPMVSARLLHLALAYAAQETALGGLSATSRKALSNAASTRQAGASAAASTGNRAVPLRPGMRLIRQWRGITHMVTIGEDGSIQWNNRTWPSLTTIARESTGTNWSGPRFFGLAAEQQRQRESGSGKLASSQGSNPDSHQGRAGAQGAADNSGTSPVDQPDITESVAPISHDLRRSSLSHAPPIADHPPASGIAA